MKSLLNWLKLWASLFFVYPIILLGFCLLGMICYSFCVWQWEPWTSSDLWNRINPLAHTWSRIVLMAWLFITGIVSNALNELN